MGSLPYFWGLQDINKDGNWTWIDGTEVDWNVIKSVNITENISKNYRGPSLFLQQCSYLVIVKVWSYRRNRNTHFPIKYIQPTNCGTKLPFSCKRSSNQLLHDAPTNWMHYLPQDYYDNLPSSCPEGFTDISTKCVRYNHGQIFELSWSKAQIFCPQHYGPQSSLVSFHDNNEILQIINNGYSKIIATSEFWIGLQWRSRLKCTMLTTLKAQLRVFGVISVSNTGAYGMLAMVYNWVDAGTAGMQLQCVPVPAHSQHLPPKCHM